MDSRCFTSVFGSAQATGLTMRCRETQTQSCLSQLNCEGEGQHYCASRAMAPRRPPELIRWRPHGFQLFFRLALHCAFQAWGGLARLGRAAFPATLHAAYGLTAWGNRWHRSRDESPFVELSPTMYKENFFLWNRSPSISIQPGLTWSLCRQR